MQAHTQNKMTSYFKAKLPLTGRKKWFDLEEEGTCQAMEAKQSAKHGH